MNRRITETPVKRPEPTSVQRILRQIEELSYKDFCRVAEYLECPAASLQALIEKGIAYEKKSQTPENKE